jgi:hypothetical protein
MPKQDTRQGWQIESSAFWTITPCNFGETANPPESTH